MEEPMSGVKQRFLGLCLPPLLLCILDFVVTMVGQSAQYWAGNYASVNEGSPTFHDLLQTHPAAFIAGGAVYVVVFVSLILLLPDMLALIVSVSTTIGHTEGAATWLWYRFHYGYQLCMGLTLLSAMLIGVGIRWGWHAYPDREYRLWKWPPIIRWGLVCLLFSVGVYLFLWPRNARDANVATTNAGSTRAAQATASTDRELEQLGRVPQLTRLCLTGTEITGAGLEHLRGFAKLQVLIIRGLQLTGADLKQLKGLGDLKWLDLENVSIPNADLKHLARLTQLEGIILRGPQVADAWLEPLKGLSQLKQLHLDGAKITDAGLAHLEGLHQLNLLDLTGTLVTSDGLNHLKGLSQLRWLYLTDTKITDAGLEQLKALTGLTELVLLTTNCTPEGEQKIQQALPKCQIIRYQTIR
jgi:hypothetical protein